MNFQSIMAIIGKLAGTLKFFPSDPDARIGIAEEIAEMAADEDQVRWLVRRLPKIYQDWPGMLEVRAAFCSRFRPIDGIETYSSVYVDGIPSEKETPPLLTGATQRALRAPEDISAAQSLVATVCDLARSKNMNHILAGRRSAEVREIPVVRR